MGLPFPKLTAEEAAVQITHGQTVAFSGFTAAGSPKAIPSAVAAKAEAAHRRGEPFKIGVLTGASTGPSLDGALAKADAISFALLINPTPIFAPALTPATHVFSICTFRCCHRPFAVGF